MNLVSSVHQTAVNNRRKLLIILWGRIHHMLNLMQSVANLRRLFKILGVEKGDHVAFSTWQYTSFSYFVLCDDANRCNGNSS